MFIVKFFFWGGGGVFAYVEFVFLDIFGSCGL